MTLSSSKHRQPQLRRSRRLAGLAPESPRMRTSRRLAGLLPQFGQLRSVCRPRREVRSKHRMASLPQAIIFRRIGNDVLPIDLLLEASHHFDFYSISEQQR